MKIMIKALTVALTLALSGSPLMAQQPSPAPLPAVLVEKMRLAQGYVGTISGQLDQLKVDLEKNRLYQLQADGRGDRATSASYAEQIRRITNATALKQAELSMYQQIINDLKQPRSRVPAIAAIQDSIMELNAERGRLNMQQLSANQVSNARESARITAQVQLIQKQIQAKQQEIKLIELQTKTGRQ